GPLSLLPVLRFPSFYSDYPGVRNRLARDGYGTRRALLALLTQRCRVTRQLAREVTGEGSLELYFFKFTRNEIRSTNSSSVSRRSRPSGMVLTGWRACVSMSARASVCFWAWLSAMMIVVSVSATFTPVSSLPFLRAITTLSKLGAIARLGSRI